MLNSIILMGRLVADPELKTTSSGISVCPFRIAVDRDYSGRNGEDRHTDFIDIVAWRQTADFVTRWFSKGSMIVVQGSLQSRKWQDKNGNNRISWEVQAASVWFGESKRTDSGNTSRSEQYAAESNTGSRCDQFEPLPDDDLPF